MPRFPVPPDDTPADLRVREIFDEIRMYLGLSYTPEIFRAMSLNPAVLRGAWENYKATILAGRVPTGLKTLIGQAIAYLLGCPSAAVNDTADSSDRATLRASLNTRERQMLDFALQCATEPDTLQESDFDELRAAGLWDDEIFELTATAGVYMTLANFGLSIFGRVSAPSGLRGTAPLKTGLIDIPGGAPAAGQLTRTNETTISARMSTVVEIGLSLMALPTFSEIFQMLSDQAKWVLDFTQVSLSLLEGGGATYRLHTLIADCSDITCEPTVSPFVHFNATEGLSGAAIISNQPLLIADLTRQTKNSPRLEAPLIEAGIRSEMILPLRIGERTFGTLNFAARPVNAYREDDLRIGRVLALQLSAALDAARLYGQIEDERSTLLAVIQSAVEGVLMIDGGAQIILANPAVESILGVPLDDLIGQSIESAITLGTLRVLLETALETQQPCKDEIVLADGRVFEASANPVLTPSGDPIGFVTVLHDVTTLKSLSRMKSEFVATVSHDLKTPITAMKLSAGLFGRAGALTAMQTSLLDRINRSADRMLALVSDLLDLGKIEAGMTIVRAPCNLSAIAYEVVEEQRPIAESKNQTLRFEASGAFQVDGDAARLKQVIANFTSNAIKYTPNAGQITVAVHLNADQVEVTVMDTGLGIPAKDLPNIFDKFYRVDTEDRQDIEGTGLGLAITRSIIEQHDGHIWVDSQVSKGSTFGFRLAAKPHMVLAAG